MKRAAPGGQVIVACREFDKTFAALTGPLGFRVDSIFPADAPTTAVVSGQGLALRLETATESDVRGPVKLRLAGPAPSGFTPLADVAIEWASDLPALSVPEGHQEFVAVRASDGAGAAGRAGMHYRDLLPGRFGGRFVASHIVIPDGGPVPDYVHFHRVRFQMIFCKTGWVRVVYEDQGDPFVLHAGDCVLQPPQIRHRVLEASTGMEVIEIGCPAVHETIADHDLALPTGRNLPARDYQGQRFVRHIAADASWIAGVDAGFTSRDTGIAAATQGLADVRVVRAVAGACGGRQPHAGEFWFACVLEGALQLRGDHATLLAAGDAAALPAGAQFSLESSNGCEFLQVVLPASAVTAPAPA